MLIVELILLLLIFLIIISQRIGIRIAKNEATTVYVNFIFIAVRLDSKKERKIKLSKNFKNRFFIKSALDYLLPKTDITIYSLKQNDNPSLVQTVLSNILLTSVLTYVKQSARSLAYVDSGNNAVDLEISFILYHGIISLILGQYYKIKNKF